MHPALEEILRAYRPTEGGGWLFESRICPGTHITLRAADLLFRGAVEAANLAHKGFSTHSTRRTFITRLWEAGVDLHTIQLLTGHKDPKALIRYIEADPNRITMKISTPLAYLMGLFVARLVSGQFKDMAQFAAALEFLSDHAWAEAFEFTPPSIRID